MASSAYDGDPYDEEGRRRREDDAGDPGEHLAAVLPLLLDTAAAAAVVGVLPATWSRYQQADRANRPPPPVMRVSGAPVWWEPEVRAWMLTRPGRTGRPPKGGR